MNRNRDSHKPAKPAPKAPGADLRWWLTQGAENCDVCEAPVSAEAIAHCANCDRAVCPLCRHDIGLPGIALCPDCAGVPPEEQH